MQIHRVIVSYLSNELPQTGALSCNCKVWLMLFFTDGIQPGHFQKLHCLHNFPFTRITFKSQGNKLQEVFQLCETWFTKLCSGPWNTTKCIQSQTPLGFVNKWEGCLNDDDDDDYLCKDQLRAQGRLPWLALQKWCPWVRAYSVLSLMKRCRSL